MFHFEFQGFLLAERCVFCWQGRPWISGGRLLRESCIGWFSSSLQPLTDCDLSGEKEHPKGGGDAVQHSAQGSLTQRFISEISHTCSWTSAIFSVHKWLFLHRADTRRRSIKSALTIWALIWSSRRAPQIHSFVNVFFLPGMEPVEGNKCGLGSWSCTFSITVIEKRILWAK